jgi:hypothetical protein
LIILAKIFWNYLHEKWRNLPRTLSEREDARSGCLLLAKW